MTIGEMAVLNLEYGKDMEVSRAVHTHDEDDWNEYEISYRGIIVGSELVTADFVREYIAEHFGEEA